MVSISGFAGESVNIVKVIEEMSHLFNGNRDGCVPELSCLLSPSISSYETSGCDPQKYNLQHHQGPYQARLPNVLIP